jgi:hypothetical protein
MRPAHRWGLVALACALGVITPYAVRARPVPDSSIDAAALAARVRAVGDTPYSGTVEVQGRVSLPVADHFTDLADLFGSRTHLRVWWRGATDWRVDRLLTTGEVDLFHHGRETVTWDYERHEARTGPDPAVRLPRDSDLLPPAVAARAIEGVPTGDLTRLPARRVAGVAAPGLRVRIADPRSSLTHVDVWVDPATGLALAVEVYGAGSGPALSSSFTSFSRAMPDYAVTRFRAVPGVQQTFDRIFDIADAADQFAPFRPPARVAGFDRSSGDAGAVGLYGSGLTRLMALPLPAREAYELADQLETSGATATHGRELLRVGPLGVMLTRAEEPDGTRWLLTGTVTDAALARAAADVAAEVAAR